MNNQENQAAAGTEFQVGGMSTNRNQGMAVKTAIYIVALVLAGAFLAPPAHALPCNTVVTTNTTLTADIICNNTWGLEINADNVTLDLNGHTILCVSDTGYLGSCQPTGSQLLTAAGIAINNQPTGYHNVVIRGPGVVSGFAFGISVAGSGIRVEGVTVTGPSVPKTEEFSNHRGEAVGIYVLNSQCNLASVGGGGGVTLLYNEILNQGEGVDLSGSCALIGANFIHDNGEFYGGWGIQVYGGPISASQNNVIYDNTIVRNGVNYPTVDTITIPNAGVIFGGGDKNTWIFSNNISGNCGYGIFMQGAADNSLITQNVVVNNGTISYGGQCYPASTGKYFDLAEFNAGGATGNVWSPNTCKTEGAGIPPGICM